MANRVNCVKYSLTNLLKQVLERSCKVARPTLGQPCIADRLPQLAQVYSVG